MILKELNVGGRRLWHHLIQSELGDLHVVQHEAKGEQYIKEDYMGWDNLKAEKVFRTTANKIMSVRV